MEHLTVAAAIVVGAVLVWMLMPRRRCYDLTNKVVVVTGAASGIGRGLAIALAQRGAIVAAVDVNGDGLASLSRDHPALRHTFHCNIADHANVVACMAEVVRTIGREVDVLVNNAGIVHGKRLLDLTPADVTKIFGINTLAHFWTTQAVLPAMLQRDAGMIVTISSVMGLNGSAQLVDYCSSKYATVGFHESLRMELRRLRKLGVHTLLVCPMAVDSGMFAGIFGSQGWWPRFVHRWLIPILAVDDVVAAVVDGIEHRDHEILSCARSWHRFVLPLVIRGSRLLPVSVMDALLSLGGGCDGMDTFRGRSVPN
ncbi:epidermal retinol dehydrogenase 2-like [Achlya hypogyna]|uniref:Epidermal retinol dehydrogenase 2-like n=1 Tax=Achlya hypogyna TaxID=1202772 RepID=A0A1V9Z8G4_ACHHY|nr:epidermal retinol dehydrogenase 2-like [Achlya hypogyna]